MVKNGIFHSSLWKEKPFFCDIFDKLVKYFTKKTSVFKEHAWEASSADQALSQPQDSVYVNRDNNSENRL